VEHQGWRDSAPESLGDRGHILPIHALIPVKRAASRLPSARKLTFVVVLVRPRASGPAV